MSDGRALIWAQVFVLNRVGFTRMAFNCAVKLSLFRNDPASRLVQPTARTGTPYGAVMMLVPSSGPLTEITFCAPWVVGEPKTT